MAQRKPLKHIGLQTIQLFDKVKAIDGLVSGQTAQQWPKALFAAQADSFELWALNLGLFVSGHGSLDYRVREAESLEATLHRFLSDLNDSLREVLDYCASDGQLTEIEEEGAPFESLKDRNVDSDIDLLLDSIRDPIDRMYKLATWIRNPSSRLRSSKALHHQQIDYESGVDFLQVVEKFDHDHIRSLILQYQKSKALKDRNVEPSNAEDTELQEHAGEDADSPSREVETTVWEPIQTLLRENDQNAELFLVGRIARANVRRRQQFAYWKKHRAKLSQHMTMFTQQAEIRQEAMTIPVDVEQVTYEDPMQMDAPVHSVTTASRLNIPQPIENDNRSTVSVSEYAPSAWRPGKEVVDFPDPPRQQLGEKFFECPYCFTLCSTDILAKKAWQAHLIHDLRPYMCTYEDCKNPNQLYDSRQDWAQHEDSFHRRVWRCPEHPALTFTHLEEYQSHIDKNHIGVTEASSNAILLASESTLTSPDRCCPICSLSLETAMALQKHIALHLERFAMFSLPRGVNTDDDDAEEEDSEKANGAFDGSRDDDFDIDVDIADEVESSASTTDAAQPVPPFVTPFSIRATTLWMHGEDELNLMHEMLFDPKRRAEGVAKVMLHGPRRSGKTKLAWEYVERHVQDFPGGVFWIYAESPEQVEEGYLRVFEAIAPSNNSNEIRPFFDVATTIQHYLRDHQGWLLVLDEIGPKDLQFGSTERFHWFIPDTPNCSILFTSRCQDVIWLDYLGNPPVITVNL